MRTLRGDNSMLDKLNEVLLIFSPERQEVSPAQAVEILGWPRSTVYRLLSHFDHAGFLDQDPETGRYRLGIRLAALGEIARQATSIQRAARPVLRDMSRTTRELCDLTVLAGPDAITVEVVESVRSIMVPGLLGLRVPTHATAAGKVLLAWLPEDERLELAKPPLRGFTLETVTDWALLTEELERVREVGYAVADGEWIPELIAVGAPVRDFRGDVVGAMAVGGPKVRIDAERLDELRTEVLEAAYQLSRTLGHGVR
jgi:IclR family transcriptional regulator, KDG regulon repressor